MKPSITNLLKLASEAVPPPGPSKGKWKDFEEVVSKLIHERNFTLISAVDWLVSNGAIPAARKDHAYSSLRQLLARRENKAKEKGASKP